MTDDNTQKYPKIINLIGQPGAGKSTLAATVFAKLKMLGVNCELVTEFAKDKTWEQNTTALSNQIYVFAKQYYRMDRCCGKVDVLITDSPLIMSPMYNKDMDIDKPLKELVSAINDKYHNLYYYVKRVKKYNPIGRSQTEGESDEIGMKLKQMLDDYGVEYTEVPGRLESADVIIEQLRPYVKDKMADTSDVIIVKE
jgi:nicotinamide riboside kinase